jgi:hypothetical protein
VLGSATFSTAGTKVLSAHTLRLSAASSTWNAGTIDVNGGAVLVVDPLATLTIAFTTGTAYSISGSIASGQVVNRGIIQQTASPTAASGASIDPSFVNLGTGTSLRSKF